MPFAIAVVVISVAVSGVCFLMRPAFLQKHAGIVIEKQSVTATVLFVAGLFLLVYQTTVFATKYGDWDAWAIWNLTAKFLANPNHWEVMLDYNVHPHPDYPLMLPSVIAFFWRVTGNTSFIVPYTVSAMLLVLIPSLIFLDIKRKSIFVAAVVLFWFAMDDWYAKHALSEYADTMLALLFLCAIVAVRYYQETQKKIFLFIVGTCCGGCIWTKNEGVVLVVLFLIFNWRSILLSKATLWFLAGSILPIGCYLIFKIGYAPENDLVAKRGKVTISYLTDQTRYELIWDGIKSNFKEQYFYHKLAFFIWLIVSLQRKRWSKEMLLVLSCFAAYLFVYLLTPMDLQWHLNTSLERLLHQLAPAFMYAFALTFTKKVEMPTKQLIYRL